MKFSKNLHSHVRKYFLAGSLFNSSKREMVKAQEEVQSDFNKIKILNLEVRTLSTQNQAVSALSKLQKEKRELKRIETFFELFHSEEDLKEKNDILRYTSQEREALEIEIIEIEYQLKNLKESILHEENNASMMEANLKNREIKFQRKKQNSMDIRSEIQYLNNERDSAFKSLANSEKKLEFNKKNILDLEESKKIVEEQLENVTSFIMRSSLSLDNQQLQEYIKLKQSVEKQASLYSQKLKAKFQELQKYKDSLENETRKQKEITEEIRSHTEINQQNQMGIEKLNENIIDTSNSLKQKEKCRDDLKIEVDEARAELSELQNELKKLTEDLKNSSANKYHLVKETKKAECIKSLRAHHPDVMDRLINLCEPIHPRYEIAFAKIFNEYADAIVTKNATAAKESIKYLKDHKLGYEWFIPLNIIQDYKINERLRQIKNPQNVKLAYDIVNFTPGIERAIRFVTKNTLVCETVQNAKDLSARRPTQKGTVLGHTCVSLNGSLFEKHGAISGGTSNLVRQIKRWDDKNIANMKMRKQEVQAKIEFASKKVRNEFKLVSLELEIEALKNRNKYLHLQMESAINEQKKLEDKLLEWKAEEEEISIKIEEIENEIAKTEEAINVVREKITDIEDKVFENFCQAIGYPNIREYELRNSRDQEQRKRIKQLEDQLGRVVNQLKFEESQKFEDEVSKYKKILHEVQAKLDSEIEKESALKKKMNEIEVELQEEREKLKSTKTNIANKTVDWCKFKKFIKIHRRKIKEITEKLNEINDMKLMLERKIREILQSSQTKKLKIPVLSEDESFVAIDYTDFPEKYKSRKNRKTIRENLAEKIREVEETEKCLSAPNLKSTGKVKKLQMQRRELQKRLQENKKNAKDAEIKFEAVKAKRSDMLSTFLTKITETIDLIYKHLTRSNSAQAFLMPQNPEEPYLSGVIYMCIAPEKNALPMEGLSGGERTMAALALLLGIQKANPAPFLLLDEVDASLDSANIKKLANCIQEEKKSMQFIVISLKTELSCRADALLGVTPGEGRCLQSCVFSFDLQKYAKTTA